MGPHDKITHDEWIAAVTTSLLSLSSSRSRRPSWRRCWRRSSPWRSWWAARRRGSSSWKSTSPTCTSRGHAHLAAPGRLIGWRGGCLSPGQCFVCSNIPTWTLSWRLWPLQTHSWDQYWALNSKLALDTLCFPGDQWLVPWLCHAHFILSSCVRKSYSFLCLHFSRLLEWVTSWLEWVTSWLTITTNRMF